MGERHRQGWEPLPEDGPDATDNLGYNRVLWDWYARNWEDRGFREAHQDFPDNDPDGYRVLGDEWGHPQDVEQVIESFIAPYVDPTSVVGELGSGGGRIAYRLAPRVGKLYCFDISKRMLEKARDALASQPNVHFVQLEEPKLSEEFSDAFDFLFAFDVFVHFDLHMMWNYIRQFASAVRASGRIFLHTSNLLAPAGWEKFSRQDRYSVEGHFFVSPETVRALLMRAGFVVVKESQPGVGNFYLDRDYLVVARRESSAR